jgi:hypothetical protein
MITLTLEDLTELFKKAGFYCRVCHGTGKVLVGPNRHGTVADMEFDTLSEAQSFLAGWKSAIRQMEASGDYIKCPTCEMSNPRNEFVTDN